MENKIINEYWKNFLMSANKSLDLKYYECFYFGMNEKIANELVKLVLDGKKRATSSCLYCYGTDNRVPQKGDLSIVTDWNGIPKCIIETANVSIIPFKDMTYDICKREGEDENLQSWQNNHIPFFTEDCKEIGREFTFDMPVVFEDFEMIYK